MKLFSRVPKQVLVVAATVAALAGLTGVVHAWFPERPTYTIQHPADHVTFDSITDNPNEGDERAFFEAKDAANTQMNGFSHTNDVKDGEEVLLRVYVHNNAADNLNGQNLDGKGVAKDTKVRIFLPTASAQALQANAYISASNAVPKEVADTIRFNSNGNFSLEYVPGSAVSYTNAVPSGIKLDDTIVTTGALIGYQKADGVIPGCFQYTSIVTIRVKVKMPSYSVAKSVRFAGQGPNDWKESISAKPGDNVEWRVEFRNNGSTTLNNVNVVDQVPDGLTVVPGSVKLYNGTNNGYVYPDSAIQSNGRQVGVNIGNYGPNSNAFVLFTTKVAEEKDLKCGETKITNLAYAAPEGLGAVNDGADVVVNKECQPNTPNTPETPPMVTTTSSTLPDTGAGDVVGIFAGTSAASAAAYHVVSKRRALRSNR